MKRTGYVLDGIIPGNVLPLYASRGHGRCIYILHVGQGGAITTHVRDLLYMFHVAIQRKQFGIMAASLYQNLEST